MKKQSRKKLVLRRETLASLRESELGRMAGASVEVCVPPTWQASCDIYFCNPTTQSQ